MFYLFTRLLARLAEPLFLRRKVVEGIENAPAGKPLLLATNHSGSFYDAVVLGTALSQPIHTFTRADVFRKPAVARILRGINLIPAYRGTEGGREHLLRNEESFRMVKRMFHDNETIVIFSEGISKQEWRLRPLAKGTGRLAWQTWFGEHPQPEMRVVPTGITYEHFHGANKRVLIRFGDPIGPDSLNENPENMERWLREFNALLTARMKEAVIETPDGTPEPGLLSPYVPLTAPSSFQKFLGSVGRWIHRPVYRLYTEHVRKKTAGTVFFDSVLYGALLYTYPMLVGIMALLVGALAGWYWGILFFVGMPLFASFGNQYR